MDRNTVYGLLLMFLLVLGYNWYFSEEQSPETNPTETQGPSEESRPQDLSTSGSSAGDSATLQPAFEEGDSLRQIRLAEERNSKFGIFAPSVEGDDQLIRLENDRVAVEINTRGGWFETAVLQNEYKSYWDSAHIELFKPEQSQIDLWLTYPGIGLINASELHFEKSAQVNSGGKNELELRLNTTRPGTYLSLRYALEEGAYDVKVDLQLVGLDGVLDIPATRLDWKAAGKHLEKGIEWERQHSSVFYRENGSGRSYLGEGADNEEELEDPLNWVAFKQNYFSAIAIARDGFGDSAYLRSYPPVEEGDTTVNMFYEARLPLNMQNTAASVKSLEFYFGPNDLDELRNLEVEELDRIIDYGWWIFGWVNRWVVRPVFNFMISLFGNVGLTIILLTLLIKMVLMPITWKNFMSAAKMRVLRPEMDEINEKHKDDAMAKQQATMALYRETGVNPFAGCLPMLLQMPILYAMFRFFPANIDLRGKSWLWAEDLGAYDAIFTWTTEIPVISSVYGNHVSGFALLMAVSTFFYSRMSMANTPNTNQPGMPNMKLIMTLFPIITLVFFNKFAAGLNFYYFCANVISIGQMVIIKEYLIDENKIHAKIQANKSKPKKKKSAFQQRLEEMQKLQEQRAKQNRKK